MILDSKHSWSRHGKPWRSQTCFSLLKSTSPGLKPGFFSVALTLSGIYCPALKRLFSHDNCYKWPLNLIQNTAIPTKQSFTFNKWKNEIISNIRYFFAVSPILSTILKTITTKTLLLLYPVVWVYRQNRLEKKRRRLGLLWPHLAPNDVTSARRRQTCPKYFWLLVCTMRRVVHRLRQIVQDTHAAYTHPDWRPLSVGHNTEWNSAILNCCNHTEAVWSFWPYYWGFSVNLPRAS